MKFAARHGSTPCAICHPFAPQSEHSVIVVDLLILPSATCWESMCDLTWLTPAARRGATHQCQRSAAEFHDTASFCFALQHFLRVSCAFQFEPLYQLWLFPQQRFCASTPSQQRCGSVAWCRSMSAWFRACSPPRRCGFHVRLGNCWGAVPMRSTTPSTQRAILEQMYWTLLRSSILLKSIHHAFHGFSSVVCPSK